MSAPKKIHKSPEPESQPSFPKEELAYFDPSAQVVPPSIVDQHIHDSIKAYNQLVKSFMKKEDDSNRFSGVELVHNKKKRDHVKCYKNGPAGPGWGGGKITLSKAGHKSLMGTEAAGGSDLLLHLNDDLLKQQATLHEKIAYLERLKSQDLPKYALFEAKSISGNIFHAKSTKLTQPFNFVNPSTIHTTWLEEKASRRLNGATEFSLQRKRELFLAVVDAVIGRIKLNIERETKKSDQL